MSQIIHLQEEYCDFFNTQHWLLWAHYFTNNSLLLISLQFLIVDLTVSVYSSCQKDTNWTKGSGPFLHSWVRSIVPIRPETNPTPTVLAEFANSTRRTYVKVTVWEHHKMPFRMSHCPSQYILGILICFQGFYFSLIFYIFSINFFCLRMVI